MKINDTKEYENGYKYKNKFVPIVLKFFIDLLLHC